MGSNQENSKYFDLAIKCYNESLAAKCYATEPEEPMSVEEFEKEMSKIFKNVKFKVTNKWIRPNI